MYPSERAPRFLAIRLRISLRIHLLIFRLAKPLAAARAFLDRFLSAPGQAGTERTQRLDGSGTARDRSFEQITNPLEKQRASD